jgi:hypothetical protein
MKLMDALYLSEAEIPREKKFYLYKFETGLNSKLHDCRQQQGDKNSCDFVITMCVCLLKQNILLRPNKPISLIIKSY